MNQMTKRVSLLIVWFSLTNILHHQAIIILILTTLTQILSNQAIRISSNDFVLLIHLALALAIIAQTITMKFKTTSISVWVITISQMNLNNIIITTAKVITVIPPFSITMKITKTIGMMKGMVTMKMKTNSLSTANKNLEKVVALINMIEMNFILRTTICPSPTRQILSLSILLSPILLQHIMYLTISSQILIYFLFHLFL